MPLVCHIHVLAPHAASLRNSTPPLQSPVVGKLQIRDVDQAQGCAGAQGEEARGAREEEDPNKTRVSCCQCHLSEQSSPQSSCMLAVPLATFLPDILGVA